jgi:hypothetical protein
MLKVDEIKVYKSAYDLNLQIYKSTKNIAREYKYSIIQDVKKNSSKLLLNIYKAFHNKDKKHKFIKKSLSSLEFIRISFRILKDLNVINLQKFILFNSMIQDITNQLDKWLKYTNSITKETSIKAVSI